MKKLMIAAAIVCAAVIAQATTAKWGHESALMDGSDSAFVAQGTKVYLFRLFVHDCGYSFAA